MSGGLLVGRLGAVKLLEHVWTNESQVHEARARNPVMPPLRDGTDCYLA